MTQEGTGEFMLQQNQEVAYVLKRFFPHRQKVALLTCSHGRINVVLKQHDLCARLWPGMVLTGTLNHDGNFWVASQVAIQYAPIHQSHGNLIWLHHLLELCYYFLPLENPAADVFFFLEKCCCLICQSSMVDDELQSIVKKVCVIKFLSLIGSYKREDIQEYLALFQELSELFVDFTNEQKVDFLTRRLALVKLGAMDEWILSCLKSHPMFHLFKTVSFNY